MTATAATEDPKGEVTAAATATGTGTTPTAATTATGTLEPGFSSPNKLQQQQQQQQMMQQHQQMMQQGYGMQMNMPPGFIMGPGGGAGFYPPHPMFMGGGRPGQFPSPGAHFMHPGMHQLPKESTQPTTATTDATDTTTILTSEATTANAKPGDSEVDPKDETSVPLGNDDTVKVETPAASGNDGDANNATPTTPLSATGAAVTGGPSNSQQQQQGGQPLMLFPQMQNMNANSPGGAGQAGGGNNMPMFFPPPGMFMNPRGFPMLGHPGGYSPYHPNMNMNAMSPLHAAVSAGISLALSCDVEQLSEYQIMVRQQLEIFQAGPEDVECNTQGRKKQVCLGQVGIRCRHCAGFPLRVRGRGAVYYPAKLDGIYQAAQNMAGSHLCQACQQIPVPLKQQIRKLRERRDNASGGKRYWADGCRALGLYETEEGLRIKRPNIP
jgi:hypothetical protein